MLRYFPVLLIPATFGGWWRDRQHLQDGVEERPEANGSNWGQLGATGSKRQSESPKHERMDGSKTDALN